MASKKKQIQIFMNRRDEQEFTHSLLLSYPSIRILDGNIWPTSNPKICESINLCSDTVVYLWNEELSSDLPSIRRPDGRFEGPISGVVIQFARCIEKNGMLLSGRIAAGYDTNNTRYAMFVNDVFKLVGRMTSKKLEAYDTSTGEVLRQTVSEYCVSKYAEVDAVENNIILKDRSTENYFRPRQIE